MNLIAIVVDSLEGEGDLVDSLVHEVLLDDPLVDEVEEVDEVVGKYIPYNLFHLHPSSISL